MNKILTFLFAMAVVFTFANPHIANGQTTDTYTVQRGDSLWKIAVKYQVGISEIISANPQFKNPDLIYPGQKVTIPLLTGVKSIESQVMQLTNQERAKYGLPALKADWELSRVARYKSADMRDKRYFDHTSPTYGSPFTMMKNFGISYRSAAENIAAGQTTPRDVVNAWMNSSGHRKNILSSGMTHIGVGYAQGGSYGHYWTQMFIAK
ncbi:SafA/ExsA family spore coat assembly protein [Bacillus sp. HMF5848]|uniref:SafA/ExsA family spore coat assembly protein n=1 Tax=Bacillus sp. HMF5848 TaxID=2495421 RepID=UPI000F7961BC|nr:SafA/ExsA family spore coat assembly protein [Bacillus sp. HMF5848]